jgi:UDP-N-acetyl-D-mannosaminuronate dehydrogenase
MKSKIIALIGLGYVGLPLAVEFGKKRKVIGFDINQSRVDELKRGVDLTLETTEQELADAVYLSYTTNIDDIKDCAIYIVTVPTPIDKHKRPLDKELTMALLIPRLLGLNTEAISPINLLLAVSICIFAAKKLA